MQNFTIEVCLPDNLLTRLNERLQERGDSLNAYVQQVLEKDLTPPSQEEKTFADILAPVHQQSRAMGLTDEEAGAFADAEVAAYRAERRAKKAASSHA